VIAQLSFLPDNDHEPVVKKASVPVAKLIDGKYCWLVAGTSEYKHEPELEKILLRHLAHQDAKNA